MWTLETTSPIPHWRPRSRLRDAVLLFTTRRGGVSRAPFDTLNLGRSTVDDAAAVRENRERLLRLATPEPDRVATAGQVHGARVVEVVTTADCMSLLYHAPGVVAAAHSGWRGTAEAMPVAALDAVCRLAGCAPDAVSVAIGPAIRGCCYEVGDDVAARFPVAAVRATGGKPRLDLPTAARIALGAAGVRPDRLDDTGACTCCEPEWYFSHRRDQGRTGRHWGVAARIEEQ
jgi:purine-nucleoside/S-methyl-5'-thioadenosine phosphorylase / adenosine deaminase